MTMSIIHRITGGALYFGTLLVAVWLMAAASSQATFDWVNWAFGTWLGRLILFGYTWALMHHMQVIIEDYITSEGLKLATIALNTFFTVAVGVASIFALLKLAFGG